MLTSDMYPKGLSPVTHSAPGDAAPQTPTTRRALVGAGVGTGLLASALTALTGRPVSALEPSTSAAEDREIMKAAMALELAVRDLYDLAAAAGADPTVTGAMREQHEAYAQALAGASGGSASVRNDTVFARFRSGFNSASTASMARAALGLENAAVATHTELLGVLSEAASARLIASIISVEARHCAVLADLAGLGSDLDALLTNTAEPIAFEDL